MCDFRFMEAITPYGIESSQYLSVETSCFSADMSDDALIRRQNLRKLGKTATELATLGIGKYSYWAAMLAEGSTKAFGEKAARQLEERLKLARGSLDSMDSLALPWPFKLVDQSRYQALGPEARGAAQSRMMDEIERQERLLNGGKTALELLAEKSRAEDAAIKARKKQAQERKKQR